ncbi:hypothetical protein NM688_g5815 [Phlebia brevispora]|uniref:Uncharacterized protein n=1 Tax=Phlebia brevispora TaxID=194682 RepID=A0ACC1SPS0_9APHY|nr:hypothetical protein NM688_g5815 [Phlebia brevispora]
MPATASSSAPAPSATSSSDDSSSQYNYTPTEYVCIIYVVLFSITALTHLFQTLKYRLWWLIPTILLASSGEVIGWAGRLWSSKNVDARDPFMMQIVCTIIAPTPFVASIFITFGHLVHRLGSQYSWLSARYYSRVFLTFDLISLIIQAAGGGIAASSNTVSTENLGGNIMLAGIVLQMVALGLFMILGLQFFISYFNNRPVREKYSANRSTLTLTNGRAWNGKLKALSGALAFASGVLMIRAVYRTIELADGWNGPVISTQVYFNVFDGAMVTLAMYTLNVFHPGRLLFSQPDVSQVFVNATEKDKNPSNTVESLA